MRTIEQQRKYQRVWLQKRRAEFFKDKKCAVCFSTERLELDHIDRTTKFRNSIWSYSTERQAIELAKCQVLCYWCHKDKTINENTTQFCGTRASYKRGCRCVECKSANAIRMREYRKSRVG